MKKSGKLIKNYKNRRKMQISEKFTHKRNTEFRIGQTEIQ